MAEHKKDPTKSKSVELAEEDLEDVQGGTSAILSSKQSDPAADVTLKKGYIDSTELRKWWE